MAKKKRFNKLNKLFKVSKQKRKSLILTFFLIAAVFIFCTYGFLTRINQNTHTSPKLGKNESVATLYFINKIGEDARSISQENDLYASVMIAQAVLESRYGTSKLASEPNYNLFGIKGDYQGNSATFQTWEDDGKGHTYTIDAQFRKYPSYTESLEDYADILSKNIYSKARKSKADSYKEATQALTGLYATDTDYNTKLNQLIKLYHLADYDRPLDPYKPGLIYNIYRHRYTSVNMLENDNLWAKQQIEN
ncbi:glucosaminidase domain-containing protein [Streptococcus dentapri]|uniref:Glucosaminidase domain-containing protein n=1 Tax=Streptococcus dentapri TaxID=573564 RepID=A0ABV8D2T6_9STRE